MSEQPTNALTNLARVKTRLTITEAKFDTLLERLIAAATAIIEGECNRTFKQTTYSDEVYSVYGNSAEMIALKQTPVTSLTKAEYRAGTPSTPAWTAFIADQYDLVGDGKSGLVRIYGGTPQGVNTIRFSYVGGYKIDFSAPTDPTKHTLPADITDLCERLVVKLFKKREQEGKLTESFEGGSVTYEGLLNDDDKRILSRYQRTPQFV